MDLLRLPLLIFVDMQREYSTPGRPVSLGGIEASLDNCRALLAFARAASWPIVHVRTIVRGAVFNEELIYSRFIEGFEPRPGEMVFTKARPSCYANADFARMMDSGGGENALLAGYSGCTSCLATSIDANHRGHNLRFVEDASLSTPLAGASESQSHHFIVALMGRYVETIKTLDIVGVSPALMPRRLAYGGTALRHD